MIEEKNMSHSKFSFYYKRCINNWYYIINYLYHKHCYRNK